MSGDGDGELRWVDVRRHSLRDASGNLSRRGVSLARRVCRAAGRSYRLFVSSPKARAIQTAEAFGAREPETDPRLALFPGAALAPFEERIQAVMRRQRIGLIPAWFAMPEVHPVLREKGEEILEAVREIAGRLEPGERALAISHGSVIEPAVAVARGGGFDLEAMGGEFAECEGASFGVAAGRIESVEILRRS